MCLPTIQEIDFETPYWENPVLKSFLWKFVALPFVPENKTTYRIFIQFENRFLFSRFFPNFCDITFVHGWKRFR